LKEEWRSLSPLLGGSTSTTQLKIKAAPLLDLPKATGVGVTAIMGLMNNELLTKAAPPADPTYADNPRGFLEAITRTDPNLSEPVFTTMSNGPAHAMHWLAVCKATFNGQPFEASGKDAKKKLAIGQAAKGIIDQYINLRDDLIHARRIIYSREVKNRMPPECRPPSPNPSLLRKSSRPRHSVSSGSSLRHRSASPDRSRPLRESPVPSSSDFHSR